LHGPKISKQQRGLHRVRLQTVSRERLHNIDAAAHRPGVHPIAELPDDPQEVEQYFRPRAVHHAQRLAAVQEHHRQEGRDTGHRPDTELHPRSR